MTHTTNFRRGLCLLLACLVLCFSVLRPVTVYATGVEEAAMAGFVGIAPEVAIPIILTLLGVAYVGAHWNEICSIVGDAIDSLTVEIGDDLYISGYEYNGKTYIDQSVVETVANAVLEYNAGKFGQAWELGKDFRYMYTIKYTNNYRQGYIWTDSAVNVTNDGKYTDFVCTGDYVSYYAYTGSNPYNEIYDSRTQPALTYAFSISNNLYDTYSVTDMAGVLDPTITYGDTIVVTNPVTEEEETAIPIASTTSVPATKTEEEVIVSPTTSDVVPGTGTADLSGILSWLKAIWDAIKALAGSIADPIVNVITSVKTVIGNIGNLIQEGVLSAIGTVTTAVNTGVQTIGDAIASVKTGVTSLVDFFTGTAYVASPLEAIHFGSLFDLFPFNIPAGIVEAVRFWGATAAAPTITIPLPTISGGSVDIYKFEINLSEIPGMDKLAAIIRAGELILFVVGLVILTEKVTKW